MAGDATQAQARAQDVGVLALSATDLEPLPQSISQMPRTGKAGDSHQRVQTSSISGSNTEILHIDLASHRLCRLCLAQASRPYVSLGIACGAELKSLTTAERLIPADQSLIPVVAIFLRICREGRTILWSCRHAPRRKRL
ncbi:hypothetical protein ACN47E_001718 [Coniothyrium glycines]